MFAIASISRKFADPQGKAIRACKETGNGEKLIKALSQIKVHNSDGSIWLVDGYTPLHLSCMHGQLNCVQILVENKHDVNIKHHISGATPLHLACQKGFIEVVKYLLTSTNCDINQLCKHGNNCLHYAVEADHKEIVAYLLTKGVNITQKTTAGRNPLLQAAKFRSDGSLVALLEKAKEDLLNDYDNDGNTILHYVCAASNKDLVQYLVDYGANVDMKNKDNHLPIDLCKGQTKRAKEIREILHNHKNKVEQNLLLSTNIMTIDEILTPIKSHLADGNNANYTDLEVDLDINNVSLNFDLSINTNINNNNKTDDVYLIQSSEPSSEITKQPHSHHWMNLMAVTCRLYGRKRFESKFRAFLLWKKLTDSKCSDTNNFKIDNNNIDNDDKDVINGQVDNSLTTIFSKIQTQHKREYLDVVRDVWSKLSSHEADLKVLGPMPLAIKPIMKSNESSLWILYCNYCTNQRDLPTKAVPASVRHHKKLLESERIWVLLRDFGVCPDVCRKTVLYDLLAEVLAEDPNDSSNSNGKSPISPVTSDNKVKSPNPRSKPTSSLSFDNFLKLLWKIASVCLEIPLASPSKRIIFLLTKMDSSNGRARMSQLFRNAKNIPAFNLVKSGTNTTASP